MKVDKRLAGGAIAVALLSVVIVGATAAAASETESSEQTEPLVRNSSGEFYTEEQMDAVWLDVTDNWPEKLPAGVVFPQAAPEFFHPNDGASTLFQTGLPELLAARYWRCAWLDESLAGNPEAAKAIGRYGQLPGVVDWVDVGAYERHISDQAAAKGALPAAVEFEIECAMYTLETK